MLELLTKNTLGWSWTCLKSKDVRVADEEHLGGHVLKVDAGELLLNTYSKFFLD